VDLLQSVELRPDGLLELATSYDSILLDPRRLCILAGPV
jgi:hypothetical protein